MILATAEQRWFISRGVYVIMEGAGPRPATAASGARAGVFNTDDTLAAVDQRETRGAVSLDLKEAFDTVNCSILINKLQHQSSSDAALRGFRSCRAGGREGTAVAVYGEVHVSMSFTTVEIQHPEAGPAAGVVVQGAGRGWRCCSGDSQPCGGDSHQDLAL